ncbi:MAG: biotin--[acetyl-CoA-carboxylase] ligase [Litorimonas sp.]
MQFIHLDSVGSTQDEARTLYTSGERGPLWVRADTQTQGRGRRDRTWSSVSGNLFATLLLPNSTDPSQSALHGFAASLAIADTLRTYDPQRPVTLKWPNDAMIGGAKISGLLIEREAEALLIGIGINLISHPNNTLYPATHLLQEMKPETLVAAEPLFTGPESVLALLSSHVLQRVETLRTEGFDPIRKDWLVHAHHLGKSVTVNGLTGVFTDLAQDGALCLILPDGTESRVHAGDVAFG